MKSSLTAAAGRSRGDGYSGFYRAFPYFAHLSLKIFGELFAAIAVLWFNPKLSTKSLFPPFLQQIRHQLALIPALRNYFIQDE